MTYTRREIEDIIMINKDIVSKRGQSFGVERQRLYNVFDSLRRVDRNLNQREKAIVRAAKLLAGISYTQAFSDGNKEVALIVTEDFLNKNGLDLPLEGDVARKELNDLLLRTIYKFENDPTIYSEVEDYVRSKVVNLPSP
jgi:prophage maintenance system killer protein